MKHLLPLVYFCFFAVTATGQKQANMWYFGNQAGINFNSGSPVPFTGSAMTILEGCASIADTAGNTLFYTNGINVWNRNNVQMSNGFGLFGNDNSAQSAIIVPAPGSPTLYYIFTTPTNGTSQMHYSIVDMTLAGGMGAVTVKNFALFNNSTEKVTAVRHANGTDIWVVGHQFNNNSFYSYLVTAAGVSTVPVITSAGSVHQSNMGYAGYMKASHNGHKLACAVTINMNMAELFDFDNTTGIPSNPVTFSNIMQAYGLEFSPDDSKLYVTEENPRLIIQWDVNAGSPAAIIASQTVAGTGVDASVGFAALQLAPDGKIYLAKRMNKATLGVINNPNASGAACNFVESAVTLPVGTSCQYGLPAFFQSFFSTGSIIAQNNCFTDSTKFSTTNENVDSVYWNFGDAASGAANTSKLLQPAHIFSAPDTFTVTLISYSNVSSDTLRTQVIIQSLPLVNLGNDSTFCTGQQLTLNAGNPGASYQWQNAGTGQTLAVNQTGTYWVMVTANGCTSTDTIQITASTLPVVNLGNDTSVCFPVTVMLNATTTGATYHWQDNSSAATYPVTQAGTYYVAITTNGCTALDTIQVSNAAVGTINLGNDTSVCSPNSLLLNATTSGATYHWQDNSSAATYQVTQSGSYSVTVSQSGCTSIDTILVNIGSLPAITINAMGPTIMCASDSVQVCAPSGYAGYLWNTGATTACLTALNAGNYYVTVNDINGCTVSSNHLAINVYPLPPISISVNGDTLTAYNATSYQWYFNGNPISGATSPVFVADQQGLYSLAIIDSNGCRTTSNSINITGIESLFPEQVNIYPNPLSTGNWQLTVGNDLIGASIEITDANGRLVFKSEIYQTQSGIELNVSRGVYLLHISSGKSSFVRKLIHL